MPTFYIYELWDSLKNEPFYVGKGKIHNSVIRYCRPYDHVKKAFGMKNQKDNNRHKLNRISKIIRNGGKIHIKIVLESQDEREILNKEIELILLYGRRDLKTGSLTNLTAGGEGVSGRIYSKADRKRISMRVRGKGNPMYGKKHKTLSKKLMSIGHTGKPGHKHTITWINKLKQDNAGGKATSVEIYQIDLNGDVIKVWDSIKKASEYLNTSRGNVFTAIKRKITCMGYFWAYTNDSYVKNNKLINIEDLNNNRLKPKNVRRIAQYSLTGNKIKEWNSQLEIKRNLNFNSDVISNIITGKRKSNEYMGYKWELA